ncbi:tetratricopeptide repeat protein [Crateriforma conspicua]|uniref:Cellulose synthase subunit BcsC n=1 Tax=Crateriforma conspicua TaxID=2527996 RepID=A0A5C5XZ70_9PLAN|nr:hypothetical protein [Crateriforma conspicua]TWT68018.1 cellulose synthase subunit BcsC [Crateriforma conspicua]
MKYLNPVNWFRWIGQFISAYLYSIPWKEAPRAIPAIILILALVVIAGVAFTDDSNWRSSLIARQLADASEQDDYETMELVLRRQLRAEPNDNDLNFRLALVLHEQERDDEAKSIMTQLATQKRFEQAARWLVAEDFVGKSWGNLDDDEKEMFGYLLKLVNEKTPDDVNFKQLYADYLIASDRMKDAAVLLEQLSTAFPMRGLQAAAIYRRLGDEQKADELGRHTLKHVSGMLDDDPTNTVLALAVAQTQLFDKQYMPAIQTIKRAVDRAKTDQERQRARSAMGEAIVAWIMHMKETATDTPESQADLMRKLSVAVRFAPDNPRVLTLVADMVLSTAQSNNPEVQKLQRTLVEGSSPGVSHFILGTGALMRGNRESAMKHLKIAAELLPQSAAILNNLAVAMTTRDDAELEDALELIERAIEQTQPKTTPHFYETRGQILYRLERYDEAIPDLLRALAVDSLKLNAHKALAVCYEKIGMEETAQGHRDQIEAMESESESDAEGDDEKEFDLGL